MYSIDHHIRRLTELLIIYLSGLQHDVIHPKCPFGLPLDFELLPKKLKEAGNYVFLCYIDYFCNKRNEPKLYFVSYILHQGFGLYDI